MATKKSVSQNPAEQPSENKPKRKSYYKPKKKVEPPPTDEAKLDIDVSFNIDGSSEQLLVSSEQMPEAAVASTKDDTFNVGEIVWFNKLKGGDIVSGEIQRFKIDKPTGNIYAVIMCGEKKLLAQIKKIHKGSHP